MAFSNRRQLYSSPMLSLVVLPFLVFLLSFAGPASAAGSAVLGIDIGTEYFKAALVKPGIPLEIVLTKDSKRKESAALAFKPTRESDAPFPERFYGGDALALAARYPDDIYINLKTLLGVPFNDGQDEAVKTYWTRFPALQLEAAPDGRGSVALRSNRLGEAQKKEAFLVEEILAMQLKQIKANADALAGKGSDIRDVVITYPVFYTTEEKRSLELAADLAGLRIQALVSDGLAVGLNYATSRTFPSVSDGEKPEYHIVYDMGAGSTTASVLRFQSRKVKDIGKFNKTIQEVHVVGAGWDKSLGGDSLNDLIVDDMVAHLVEDKNIKGKATPAEIKAHGKTMSRLWKDSEKLRQVLSANTETSTSFEGLYYENVNFKYKLSRANFEKMASEYVARIGSPVEQALTAAGLQFSDIESIVLHGGAIRTPFVQKQLENFAGSSKKIRTNVNADEAAVFGAAFKGAALSPSFRVKDIRTGDAAAYPISLKWNSDGKQRNQKLFTATSQVGPEKQVTVKNLEDFEFSFAQHVTQDEERPILSVQTHNLTASVAKLKDNFGCTNANITTKFTIRLSPVDGLPEVVAGTVSCEVEAEKKGIVEDVKDFFGLGKKDEQEPLGEDGEPRESITLEPETESSTTSSASAKTTTTSSKDTKKDTKKDAKKDGKATPQVKLEVIPISLKSVALGTPVPSVAELSRIKSRLLAFDNSDRERIVREEALNELESFIYRSRDLADNEEFIKAVKPDQLTVLSERVSKACDWLYEESDNAKTADFQSKLKDLKAIVDPALKRMKESSTRPARVQLLQDMLKNAESMKELIKNQIENDEQLYSSSLSSSSASSTSTSTETSSSTPAPATSDEGVDLDEDPYSASSSSTTSTKSAASAKPTGPKYSLFTPADLRAITEAYESTNPWLETQLSLQEKLGESDDPALTVVEVDSRLREFERILNRMYERMTSAAGQQKKSSSNGKKGSKEKKKSEADKAKAKDQPKEKEDLPKDEL
ncbi:Heat shock protein 70 family [Penicillium cf. griseofulvum]|uniref:Heat shock protein 70 family n=1 Tax=Penicillium cf. griseofulvum TaxID=2972120 RepID=A0A9W9M3Q3_9EURO|nr:Heat shock protein 70 family [Penicillium cf. griseofulvum]KAJ5433779.1 Heat shock protein 70 family [Penicillium cf. griseofulvum]